jgi:predicted amidophosphoribosyltransferase
MKIKSTKRAQWWCDGCDGAIVAIGKRCPRCGRKNRQIGKSTKRFDKPKKIWYN